MDLNLLQVFVETMRRRSFAEVARDRNVDPATVSRQIAALENELNLRLFQRSTRQIEPTAAALVYFERVEPLVEELRRAQLAASEVNQTPKGELRISSPVSFAELNLVPLLPEFAGRFPELTFDLLLTDADLDLIANKIDAAVRVGAAVDSSLIAYKLSPMNTRVCASPAYLAQHGRPNTPAELVNHNCLILGYRGFAPDAWRFRCKKSGKTKSVRIKEHLRSSNAMAAKICALAGMGVALQAEWMIGRELGDGRLIDLFPDDEVTSATTDDAAAWLLYPSREFVPQKTRAFIEFLKEKFKDGAPWTRN